MNDHTLFADHALLPTGWASDVLLQWDAAGTLTLVRAGHAAPADVARAPGPVLPGLPNLHSHAFQRAMAGLSEYRGSSDDSFWSWRERMYALALSISPEQLEAVATALYVEMLEAGYTSVCEFHYLHHDVDGRAYADDRQLSLGLLRAAQTAGIGLTLLPVLYQTSGFGEQTARSEQRRFVYGTDAYLRLLQNLQEPCAAQGARLGFAPHSLRAVPLQSLREVERAMAAIDPHAPIHIHIAEQTAEVDACLAFSGQRPVAWLLDHLRVDQRWCLVHATHLSADEQRRAAASGAVAGLCPTTEANLGDGIFDASAWRAHGGRWGVGSDSHICVNAAEELQQLEYSQRLATRRRNVLARAEQPWVATALTLEAVAGGAQASGRPVAGLDCGQRADFVILDAQNPLLRDLPHPDALLSAHVFASHRRSAIAEVWVGGACRVREGRHPLHEASQLALVQARRTLNA